MSVKVKSNNDQFLCVSKEDLRLVLRDLESITKHMNKFLGYGLPSDFSVNLRTFVSQITSRVTNAIDKGNIMSVEVENNGATFKLSQKETRELFSSLGMAREILQSHIAIANGSSSNSYQKGVESIYKIASIFNKKKDEKNER